MAIFMKVDGIKGSATAKGQEDSIVIKSLDFGCKKIITSKTGHANNRVASSPQFSEVTLHKSSDISSPDLFTAMLSGKSMPEVIINICDASDSSTPHVTYTLSNVLISAMNDFITENSSIPLENISLNFTKIEKKFIARNHSNQAQSPVSAGYNCETAEMM